MSAFLREWANTVWRVIPNAGCVLFYQGSRLWRWDERGCKAVVARAELTGWGFAPDGFWLSVGEDPSAIILVDENGEPTRTWPDPTPSSKLVFSGNRCAYLAALGDGDFTLRVVDVESGAMREGPATRAARIAVTDEFISLRTGGKVEVYTWELDKLWGYTEIASVRTMRSSEPFICQGVVIINCGVANTAQDPCTIKGFDIHTGSTLWSYTTQAYATLTVQNESVGLASAGRMIALDAKTGTGLFDGPCGFEKPHAADTLWAHAGRLVYTSLAHGAMRVFDAPSGSLVAELRLTRPYGFPEDSPPVAFGDGFVARINPSNVALRGIVSGLLVVPSFDVESGDVAAEPRTPHSVGVLSGPEGESYRIEMQPDELDRGLRFGAIAMKETAIAYGAHVWSDDRRNKRFNGKVELAMDLSHYDERERGAIAEMVAESDADLRKLSVFAGNGKGPIALRLVPLSAQS